MYARLDSNLWLSESESDFMQYSGEHDNYCFWNYS